MNHAGYGQDGIIDKRHPVTPGREGANTRILSIEIGRGLAALAVVLFHANIGSRSVGGPYLPWMSVLEHGVDFFFVLSGFIIYTAHSDDIGKVREVSSYIKKRCIRLFPLLWAVVFGYAVLRAFVQDPMALDTMTLLRSAIPYPSLEDGAPLVVWTLRHELLFYLLFALVIWRPAIGWPVIGLWGLGSFVQIGVILADGAGLQGVSSMVFSSFTLDFLMGIGLAVAYRHRRFGAAWWPLLVGLGVLVSVLALTYLYHIKRQGFADYVSIEALLWVPVLGAAFATVVYGLLRAESFVSPRNWLIGLGSASYAIYLVHTPVGGALLRVTPYLPQALIDNGAILALLVAGGVAAGYALHHYFERPVARWLRRRYVPSRNVNANAGIDRTVPVANAKGITDTMR